MIMSKQSFKKIEDSKTLGYVIGKIYKVLVGFSPTSNNNLSKLRFQLKI